ncbi:hypothetical protein A4H97_20875 [Niastella yeongjuensis]|uniref:Uncharacterized protein n=1 Tax=Niastella yeongjuensis TaxID=354355 RepID=A0A1V9FCN3_9BACT|nr:hypothetical protein [Niastella yeongjuensis]OQP56037.1 hypothetical protein A4H97_20875 [Niastella yeongjuensis]SEP24570.1 hypothetical protein SAMN05660816_04900 [Niastella yeongjuensis]
MSLNFFRTDCQFPPITSERFGLCDKNDGTKAYPDTVNEPEWIATVGNPEHHTVTFTAIDNCVMKNTEYRERGRCDVMLTTTVHLYLVELKDQMAAWRPHAVSQLVSTIDFLLENHPHEIRQFKKKKAFAANRRHPRFAFIENEDNLKLFRRTGFRIDSQAEIILI